MGKNKINTSNITTLPGAPQSNKLLTYELHVDGSGMWAWSCAVYIWRVQVQGHQVRAYVRTRGGLPGTYMRGVTYPTRWGVAPCGRGLLRTAGLTWDRDRMTWG